MFLYLIRALHHRARLVLAGSSGCNYQSAVSVPTMISRHQTSEFSGEKVILHRLKGVVHLDLSLTESIG